ncbi:MAG TPA: amino acid ABC transporter permease [Hyphomicrobiaceae bacterium]
MQHHFDYDWLLRYYSLLLHGIAITVELTVVAAAFGTAVGIVCAWVRCFGKNWARLLVTPYIELIRNTPFIIQLFFIFFGLPSIGMRLGELQAANIAVVVNLGAYSCEIIRAGIQATPRGQWEAGSSLAMSHGQVFRHVVLVPALQRIWPALTSQVVIVMLGSAVVSQIAAVDITFAANFIQSRSFRAFEAYFVATGIYLGLAVAVREILAAIGRFAFPRRISR